MKVEIILLKCDTCQKKKKKKKNTSKMLRDSYTHARIRSECVADHVLSC